MYSIAYKRGKVKGHMLTETNIRVYKASRGARLRFVVYWYDCIGRGIKSQPGAF